MSLQSTTFVSTGTAPDPAPDAALEPRVLDLFRRAFERDDIGLDDDFFALGGDSLLATRLLSRLEEMIGRELPPDTLFHTSSPRGLAALMTPDEYEVPADRSASLVSLNRVSGGRPVFLMHPTSGNPWVYRPLVQHLAFARPMIAARAPDLDWARDVLTLSEMAQHYTTEIRRVQRRGPYTIAGYSVGGNLAFEIAIRLLRDRQEVDRVIMFDTFGPRIGWRRIAHQERIVAALRRLVCHAGWRGAKVFDALNFRSPMGRTFLCLGTGPLTPRELRRVMAIVFPEAARKRDLRHASLEELSTLVVEQFQPVVGPGLWEYLARGDSAEDARVLVKAYKVWAKNHWLGMRHLPRGCYPGPITIYACADNHSIRHWQPFSTQPLDIRPVTLSYEDHTELMEAQNVPLFAEDLRRLLEDNEPSLARRTVGAHA